MFEVRLSGQVGLAIVNFINRPLKQAGCRELLVTFGGPKVTYTAALAGMSEFVSKRVSKIPDYDEKL
ncbi:hypothetical protein KA047_01240 [Candidatus Saccharibacteria bacterium]|nr:hypothetical protein [Candidatus Saccharibacteria bacterium]